MTGSAPSTTPITTVINNGRERRLPVTRRTPSAMATAALGAPAAIRNQPKKPMPTNKGDQERCHPGKQTPPR